jgi:hypothetical protein
MRNMPVWSTRPTVAMLPTIQECNQRRIRMGYLPKLWKLIKIAPASGMPMAPSAVLPWTTSASLGSRAPAFAKAERIMPSADSRQEDHCRVRRRSCRNVAASIRELNRKMGWLPCAAALQIQGRRSPGAMRSHSRHHCTNPLSVEYAGIFSVSRLPFKTGMRI